ncbi:MAG: hypothetical protein J6Z11_06795 [Candidatus Riflebacteria bacterium]|nr:hypothetical protein [Candidatus Riflebacteria bacterium]
MDITQLDENLVEGMNDIQTIYNSLNSQAKELVKTYTKQIDDLIKKVSANINNLSNEDIRSIELQLSLMAYDLGELKDKTCIAAEIAEIVQDETEAEAWNTATGNNEQRKNTAILASSKEKAVAKLYKLVASQIKTKLDEAHRVVDTLKSILISRASDRKLTDNYEGQ